MSNYRLYFHAAPRTLSGSTLWPDWGIPVHCVCTLEASKSQDNLGPNGSGRIGRTLIIGFKDGQMKRFSTVRPLEEAHVLTDEMHALQRSLMRQAFKPEETFAKVSQGWIGWHLRVNLHALSWLHFCLLWRQFLLHYIRPTPKRPWRRTRMHCMSTPL